jgi:alkylation response protein AidB-like acyl-CoA dehydrogenase
MDFGDTPEEAAFRAEAREWLRANAPVGAIALQDRSAPDSGNISIADEDEHERAELARAVAWQHELCDAGWAGITWPREFGGRGGTPLQQAIFAEEVAAFDAPSSQLFYISIGMVGPTLIAHGSEEQQVRHLPAILRGDEIWCQLFSEPGAGSDLAGLNTRARRDDGGWIINGQKVWTTGARLAQYGALLARTDGSVPKHRGLSYIILDMSAPGIEIRPLRQITGDSHFNEVFLTDVWVPDDAVVGDVNDGWRVANTMLLSERGTFGDRDTSDFDAVVELARRRGRVTDGAVRQEIAKLYGRDQVIRLLTLESRTALSKGTSAPMIASVTKLLSGVRNRHLAELALDLLGAEGIVAGAEAFQGGVWQDRFLMAPVGRIAGGTDEIQKNILGERFLGIPKEPRSDKDVAFDDVRKA